MVDKYNGTTYAATVTGAGATTLSSAGASTADQVAALTSALTAANQAAADLAAIAGASTATVTLADGTTTKTAAALATDIAALQAAIAAASGTAAVPAVNDTQLTSRFRLVVTATTESDNGLSFGAQVRYQSDANESGYQNNAAFNMPRLWVSTGGLTVSVGNTMGAFEFMPGMYAGSIGLTGLGYKNVVYNYGADFYSSGSTGRMGIDVVYSAGAFGAHLTHSANDAYLSASNGTTERTALVLSYSAGDYTVAAGVQDSTNAGDTDAVLTASGKFGGVDLTLQYADNGTNDTKYGLAASYGLSAATKVSGFINKDNNTAYDVAGAEDMNYGIGFSHSLGGGTSIQGGIVNQAGVNGAATLADLGLFFSF